MNWVDPGTARTQEMVCRVAEESAYQIRKWGVQVRSPFEWLTYLAEEVGELAEEISECVYRGGAAEDIAHEAIQAATLALKIAVMASGSHTEGGER